MMYAFLIALLFPFLAMSSPAEEISEHSIPVLDTVRDLLGNKVNYLANDFDSFFATERADDELGRSLIRIRKRFTIQERELLDDNTSIRFNIRLPSLERRFKNMVEDSREKKGESLQEKESRIRRYREASQLNTEWLFRSDVAVNASIHPNITGRARLRKSFRTHQFIHRFVQEATWRSYQEGFRQRTQANSDYSISRKFLFRFGNLVDWKISQKDFTTGHGPALYHRLSDDDAMTYNYSVNTVIHSGSLFLSNHQLSGTYRRNLYQQFIYMDFSLGLDFPKKWSFRRTPFAYFQIETLFGS